MIDINESHLFNGFLFFIVPHEFSPSLGDQNVEWTGVDDDDDGEEDLEEFNEDKTPELHAFSDASLQATGHVIYIRYRKDTTCHTTLVTASSKVAPKTANTVPRLERCAALDAAGAVKEVARTLAVNDDDRLTNINGKNKLQKNYSSKEIY